MKDFLKTDINFYPDKITYIGDKFEGLAKTRSEIKQELVIMHEWETEIMKKSADFVCERGGDILEIGFGMGISAGFIQDAGTKTHTIIELHPQIATKAREWAADKQGVTIIEGDWIKVLPTLMEGTVRTTHKKFDGVFFDPYGFWSEWNKLPEMIKPHCKSSTRISHFNSAKFEGSSCGFMNHPDFSITFEKVEIDPPENDYYNEGFYYIPKVLRNE